MSANAQDLRWYYAAKLGDTQTISAIVASATKNTVPLQPGRYLLHFSAWASTGVVYVRQAPHATVEAVAGDPSTPMSPDGIKGIEITVKAPPAGDPTAAPSENGISVIMTNGTCSFHITKINRDT